MPNLQKRSPARLPSALRLAASRVPPRLSQAARETLDVLPLSPDIVEVRVRLESEAGLVEARRLCRLFAIRGRFRTADQAILAAIVSELSRNILLHAGTGYVVIKLVDEPLRRGILVCASDNGPGIGDVARARKDGFSSLGRAGLGLPGVKRLADRFEISSSRECGTSVTALVWRR